MPHGTLPGPPPEPQRHKQPSATPNSPNRKPIGGSRLRPRSRRTDTVSHTRTVRSTQPHARSEARVGPPGSPARAEDWAQDPRRFRVVGQFERRRSVPSRVAWCQRDVQDQIKDGPPPAPKRRFPNRADALWRPRQRRQVGQSVSVSRGEPATPRQRPGLDHDRRNRRRATGAGRSDHRGHLRRRSRLDTAQRRRICLELHDRPRTTHRLHRLRGLICSGRPRARDAIGL
jgi:hypothetical protein